MQQSATDYTGIPARSLRSLARLRFSLWLPFCAATVISLTCLTAADAEPKLTPIHLHLGGKEFIGKTNSLTNGKEIFVPVELLKALGIESKLTRSGDAVVVTLPKSTKHREIALARPKGKWMLPLASVVELVDGVVLREEDREKDSPVHSGEIISLLARVTDARFVDGSLKVTTSFPVPFHARTLVEASPLRGYVDCVGAVVTEKFKPQPLLSSEHRALRIRAAQNSAEVARVVVELSGGYAIKSSDAAVNSNRLIVAGLERSNGKPLVASAGKALPAKMNAPDAAAPKLPHSKPAPSPPVQIAKGSGPGQATIQKPGKIGDTGEPIASTGAWQRKGDRKVPGRTALNGPAGTANPRSEVADPDLAIAHSEREDPTPPEENVLPGRGKAPSRGGFVKRTGMPIEVSDLVFTPVDDKVCRVELQTAGRAGVSIHYIPGTTQMVMDLSNTRLKLADDDSGERTVAHPLVRKIHVTTLEGAQPLTRVTLDMARIAGFTINTTEDRCSLELRLPRNAYGVLADKTIVVDAGHGGSASGATGRNGVYTVFEKDITLAIALKLRTTLESCGARVVMTRDHDTDVGLDARPGLANEIGADLFISIHNDSNGAVNSASGTSTYYPLNDVSSRALATCVQYAVMGVTGLPSRGVLSDGVMYASGFAVLRGSKMPAVLCEVAYINNTNDAHKLLDSDFQQRVAQAMCDGIRSYIEGGPSRPQTKPMIEDNPQPGDSRDEDGKEIKQAPSRERPMTK